MCNIDRCSSITLSVPVSMTPTEHITSMTKTHFTHSKYYQTATNAHHMFTADKSVSSHNEQSSYMSQTNYYYITVKHFIFRSHWLKYLLQVTSSPSTYEQHKYTASQKIWHKR